MSQHHFQFPIVLISWRVCGHLVFLLNLDCAFSFPIGFLCCSNSRPWLRLETTVKPPLRWTAGRPRLRCCKASSAQASRDPRPIIIRCGTWWRDDGWRGSVGGLRDGVLLRCWRWFQNPSFYGKRYLFFLSWKRKDIILKKLKHGVSTKIVSECMFILLIINSLYLSIE